ncbi:ABC transporter, partial [Streptomyces sp. T-3]|nr:ABC transporter [Streptomyces sp. T-3]
MTMRWSWYTWRRDNRSLRRALPTLTVLSALLAASAGVAAGATGAIERDVLASGGLTQIELSSFEGESSVRPLTTDALADAARLPGVTGVVPDYPATLYAEDDGTYDLSGHTLAPDSDIPVVKGKLPERLADGQVVLPAKAQGTDFASYLGKRTTFGYTKATGRDSGGTERIELEAVALYDPSWQVDGRDVAYMSEGTAALLAAARAGQPVGEFRAKEGAQSAVVAVAHQSKVAGVAKKLQDDGFSASPVADRVRQLPGLFGAADLMVRVAVVLLALAAVGLGVVRASDSMRARLSQFAVLRVLGSSRSGLRQVLLGEALLSGVV